MQVRLPQDNKRFSKQNGKLCNVAKSVWSKIEENFTQSTNILQVIHMYWNVKFFEYFIFINDSKTKLIYTCNKWNAADTRRPQFIYRTKCNSSQIL